MIPRPRRPAVLCLAVLSCALAARGEPAPATGGAAVPPAAARPVPAGPAVVLKTGQRIACAEPPVIAFGRVLYKTADGIQHALALEVVDVEKTRASGTPSQPAPAAAQRTLRIAPDFTALRADGTPVKLSELRGRVVLVDFWATWCGPCVMEMPAVRKLHEKLAGPDFEIVGVSLDSDRAKWERFVKENKLAWPHYFDGKGWSNDISRKYGVRSIPMTVLLDREGQVVRTALRGPALEPAVAALIASTKRSGAKTD